MKAPVKILLAVLVALLVTGAAILVAVVTLVDPARYRTAIADAVRESTGRTLSLDGDVGLKLLPCCAVELQQAALGNPPGFPAEPFLRIESARLAIRLWPLLTRREVEIGTVRLNGLRASLIGLKDGRNNWSFARPAMDPAAAEGNDATAGVASFALAGIDIRDASLDYSDEADGSRYRVDQLQLTTGAIRNREPFELTSSLRLTNLADSSGASLQLSAGTRVTLADDVTTVGLARVNAELETSGLAGLDTVTGRIQSPTVEVRLASDTVVTAPELAADLQLRGPALPGGSAPLKMNLKNLRYDVDAGAGTFAALTATTTLAGVALDVDGEGRFGPGNDLHGTVRFPVFSPREVLPNLKMKVPDTADPEVLRKFSGSASWFLRDKVGGLENLALVLDDTKFAGSVSQELLPEGSKAIPRTRFDLTIDALNADRYLAPDAAPQTPSADGEPRKEPPTEIPTETLRALNLDGRARIGRLTINGLKMADVDVTTTASAGRVRLEPLTAKLYGGAFRGGLRLDATGQKARVALNQTLSSVTFGALLADLADVKNITGTMNLTLDGEATGATDDELLENLNGNLTFSLADGVYKGMDVWYEIRRANALLRQSAPPLRTGPGETPIKSLDLAGKLSNGVLRTERFAAEIPFLRVSGDAMVNLPKGTLDSDLTALVFEKPVFADDTSLERLVNVRLPLTVKGPIAGPRVRVDLGRMVKGALTESLQETLQDKLRKKLGLGAPAGEETPPADGEPAAPAEKNKNDAVKKGLDRLFR